MQFSPFFCCVKETTGPVEEGRPLPLLCLSASSKASRALLKAFCCSWSPPRSGCTFLETLRHAFQITLSGGSRCNPRESPQEAASDFKRITRARFASSTADTIS